MLLEKQASQEIKKAEKEALKRLKDYETTHEAVSKNWFYREVIGEKVYSKILEIKETELKRIVKNGIHIYYEKELKKALKKISLVKSFDYSECNYGICSIDWIRNRTWGNCPKGEYRNGHDYMIFRSITGCGFDKLSTLTADMFNADKYLLSYICNYIEKHGINKDNIREKIGYGIYISYGMPFFDGGVGIECHKRILNKIGFTVIHTETQKSDYIEYDKKRKGN